MYNVVNKNKLKLPYQRLHLFSNRSVYDFSLYGL